MNKIDSTNKINAGFLILLLIAGTFAAISPSFIFGAHAQEYGIQQKYNSYESDYEMDNGNDEKKSYGKENNYYKSKDSSNVQCNNVNANLNGFNGVQVGTLPTALNGLATDNEAQASADEGEIGASSSGSNDDSRPSGHDSDSRVVCIYNNNNIVLEGEEPISDGGEEPISELCEECFAANSMLQTAIEDFLDEFDGVISTTFITVSAGEIIAEDFITGAQINTLERFCNQIENAAETIGVPLSDELIRFILLGIIEEQTGSTTGFESGIEALIECLLEAGIIVDREPQSISANNIYRISSPNVQCTGDPLCAKLEPLKKYLVRNNMGHLWPF